ncbi:MAG: adenylate/guanylate cyclase domain-containing protein [Cyanobacteria bacterium J06649_5]
MRQLAWQWRGVLAIAPSVAGVVILMRGIGLLQAWEWAAFDQYMRLRPPEMTDNRVVIVGLDENDVSEIGQAIVPDEIYAQLITKLRDQSPRAIGFDIYRDLPVEPGHDALNEVYKATPNLVGIQKVVGEAGRERISPPPVLADLGQVSANDIIPDADNTVRRGLISVRSATGETVYGLSLYLALLYLEPEGIAPQMVGDDSWWLGKTLFEPFESNDGGYVRADAQGYQQVLNYRGASQSFEQVSVMDVLNDRLPDDWARDRIVLIGAVGDSFKDSAYTPYSSSLLSIPETMSGVEIHAQLTSQLISAALEGRPLIRSWSEPVEWAWILLWSGMSATLIWQCGKTGVQPVGGAIYKRYKRELGIAGLAATLGGVTYVPFWFGWWLPVVPAALSAALAATAVTAYLAHTAKDIRRTFGRYLSDDIVTALLETPGGQKLGGDRRQVTILTSDLRGFTALSSRLSPEMVIKILNFYLGHMAEIVARHHGTIDEFMGDGILILFGAPMKRENDAQRAVACALDMQLAMEGINKTIAAWDVPALEMGIGIHTGEVVVGNIGSEKRAKYGVVGSPVNLTYRIESCTLGGQVLISDETLEMAGPGVSVASQQTVMPKGIAKPIMIHEVTGLGAPYDIQLPQPEEIFSPLKDSTLVCFRLVKDKQVGSNSYVGEMVELSAKGAIIVTEAAAANSVELMSNIKLNFLSMGSATTHQDIYAKVVKKDPKKDQIQVCFTAVPPNVMTRLQELRTDNVDCQAA